MPDGWELSNGLNLKADDASDDPDGDWLTNLQEYNYGTNSTNPHDRMVVAWGDNFDGQADVPLNLRDVVSVAGGVDHSLALRSNGKVVAWGDNSHSQTNVPSGLVDAVAIAGGPYHNLALRSDGTVTNWGSWWSGGSTFHSLTMTQGLANVIGLAAGRNHDLALKDDRLVTVWGYTNTIYNTVPGGLNGVRAVASGWNHNLALRWDGTVTAWGESEFIGWPLLTAASNLTSVAAIAVGAVHSLALRSNGTVVAWGYNADGQTNVPAGLSNVVAVAAGEKSMALRDDGTVVTWPDTNVPAGLNGVVAIASGFNHRLAVRAGRLTPVILEQPVDQVALTNNSATFTAKGVGLAGVHYQWQLNGTNISAATNATLTLDNVQVSNEGNYRVLISTGAGSITSSVATLSIVRTPQVVSTTPAVPSTNWITGATNLSVVATAAGTNVYPISYQWKRNGSAISSATNAQYSLDPFSTGVAALDGDYSVDVSNMAGSTNVGVWRVRALRPGMAAAWGANDAGQLDRPPDLTNIIALAAGEAHSVAVKEDSTVVAWGSNTYGQTNIPSGLSNVIAVAAGSRHNLALKENGTLVAWGTNDLGQTNVPGSVTNAIAISACGHQSLALKKDGTVEQWGQTNAAIPSGLSGVRAIASGTNFHLALLSNTTVVAWGNNANGQTSVPSNLSNVVAIAAGGAHALGLKSDGTVTGWGLNSSGQTTVPSNLTNAMRESWVDRDPCG